MLKFMLQKKLGSMWTGFMWLRIRNSGRLLSVR